MPTPMSKRRRFLLNMIFVGAAALIFLLVGITYRHMENINDRVESTTRSYEINQLLQNLQANLYNAATTQQRYPDTQNPEYRRPFQHSVQQNDKIIQRLQELVEDTPEQRDRLQDLTQMVKARQHRLLTEASFTQKNTADDAKALQDIAQHITAMQKVEMQLLEDQKSAMLLGQKYTPLYFFLIALIALGLVVFTFSKISSILQKQANSNSLLKLELEKALMAEQVGKYGVWTYNTATGHYEFSDNEYRLLGYEPKAFPPSYDKFMQHVHPDDAEKLGVMSSEMLQKGFLAPHTYRIFRADGQMRYFRAVAKSEQTAEEQRIFLGITTDITAEMKVQLNLQETNEKLQDQNRVLSIANTTYQQAEIIGEFGTIQYFPAAQRFVFSDYLINFLGLPVKESIANLSLLESKIYPSDVTRFKNFLHDSLQGKVQKPVEIRFCDKDKKKEWFSLSSTDIYNEKSSVYTLITARRITPFIQNQQKLREQNQALENTNKDLQAFNYVASHDLQEPLRKIETFISRLIEKDLDKLSGSGQQYVERIHFSAGRMRKLITDLLEFSRATKSEQNFEDVDLNQILKVALDNLQSTIEEKKAIVESEKLPDEMKAIPFQMQQLFTNLIGNGIKYSHKDSAPHIRIQYSETAADEDEKILHPHVLSYHQITVTDNGIGFENQYATKVFELFERLHGKQEYEGTGIGLAICKKIVENHGGRIFANSVPGVGSIFTVRLPQYH